MIVQIIPPPPTIIRKRKYDGFNPSEYYISLIKSPPIANTEFVNVPLRLTSPQ